MLLGVVLLYVGVVLVVNGIWLIGQAQAAAAARRAPAVGQASAREAAAVGASVGEAAAGQVSAGEAAARRASAGEAAAPSAAAAVSRAEASPMFIQNREVAVLNIFTGFVGVVAAVTLLVTGNRAGDLASVRAGGYILLFAFTYLWVSFNQYLNAGGHLHAAGGRREHGPDLAGHQLVRLGGPVGYVLGAPGAAGAHRAPHGLGGHTRGHRHGLDPCDRSTGGRAGVLICRSSVSREPGTEPAHMHPSEWNKLREVEELLRRKDPDLDAFLAGRSALRRPRAVIWAVYLAILVLIVLGVALDTIAL